MTYVLRQSTSVDIPVGPFLDSTDGNTQETALTLTQPDIRLKKNNANWAQKNAAQTLTHEEAGWYEVTLDATDTNTLGMLKVAIHESGALPVWLDCWVVTSQVWDSLFSTDLLQVDTREVSGTAQTAGDIMADTNDIQTRLPAALVSGRMDASVGAMAANVVTAAAIADGAIDAATFAAGAIDAAAIAADAIGSSELAASAVTEIQSGLATSAALTTAQADLDDIQTRLPAALISGRIDASVGAMAANVMTAAAAAADLTTELQTGLATAAALDAVDNFVDTEVAAIKAVTDKLDTALELDGAVYRYTTNALEQAPAGGGGGGPTAAAIADAVWDEAMAAHLTAGTTGQALNAAGGAADPLLNAVPGAYASGTAGYALGSLAWGVGSRRWVYTVTNTVTGLPLPGVTIYLTSDLAGSNITYGPQITNSLGQVQFLLDPGTVYVWRQLAGFNFDNPDTEIVV